eukprot:gene903-4183_t
MGGCARGIHCRFAHSGGAMNPQQEGPSVRSGAAPPAPGPANRPSVRGAAAPPVAGGGGGGGGGVAGEIRELHGLMVAGVLSAGEFA